MRILIVSQWYSPEPVKVVEELAAGLAARGHSVEVLTGFPNYPTGRVYDGYRMRLWQRETLGDIPLVRVPLVPDHSRSALGRLLNYGSFAFFASVLGTLLTRKCDVVFVYGSPATAILPGRVLAMLKRASLVVLVPDLWPEVLEGVGVKSRVVLRAAGAFARSMYRSAKRVIAVTRGFADRIASRGVPRERIAMIPMWVDVKLYRPLAPEAGAVEARPFVVMHAGQLGVAQGLDALIDAAALLRDDASIELAFAGDGNQRAALEQRVAELALTNVRFLGTFPPSEMSRVYAHASALIVHLTSDPTFDIWIPHKLYAYLAAGKPILCAVAGETAEIVRDARAGVTCTPGDAHAIAARIRELASMPEEERAAMGARGRALAESVYDMERVLDRIARVIEDAHSSS